ncbi:MAG: YlqF/YawG family GTPase [Promethearchaeota archaeon]
METSKHWKDIFNIVIKETDFILEILDARNPEGTHNKMIEKFIKANRPEVELILLINKTDIIPERVLNGWIKHFRNKGYNVWTCSAKYNRGIQNIFRKLRNKITRPNSNVLIVGYPNTGKSTLIEGLTKNKKKLGTSSRAGYTRVIQKIKLTNLIYLLDSPGVIPIEETNETDMAIKACMTADKLNDPLAVVEAIYKLIKPQQFQQVYKIQITEADDLESIIQKIGKRSGKLVAGGRVNENEVQKLIIRDWQLNKLHYYCLPPNFNKKQKKNQKEIQKSEESSQNRKNLESLQKGVPPPSLNLRKRKNDREEK